MDLWKTLAWSPEQEQIIYREWGLFYTRKQNLDVADLYYNKSLELNPDDEKALYCRSQCKRSIAQNKEALADAERALALDESHQPYNLAVCECVYGLNELEKTQVLLTNFARKFTGKKTTAFYQRKDVVNENFQSSLGDSLGEFIIEYGDHFDDVYSEMMRLRNIDNRPLWKIMKDQEKCDVLSIPEVEDACLPPREIARRDKSFRIFNQTYLHKSWIDVLFLKSLKTNKDLLLPQSQMSRPILETITKTKYDVVIDMLKMLNARSPLYTEKLKNCPDKTRRSKKSQEFLFRVQYQVHRSMMKMLKTMYYFKKQRKLQKLRKYVEEVMGDYVVLKTNRVMPWKFQFINEVYNILALAMCDQFEYEPAKLSKVPQKDRLIALLKVDTDMEKELIVYEFGNRATHQNPDITDKNTVHKALAARLEKRLHYSKYPIERAYLWYEIARCDLRQNRFDKCCLVADRCIAEASTCNSKVWMLHGIMLTCMAHALLRKVEKISLTLNKALKLASTIKSDKVTAFLHYCYSLNTADISNKKLDEAFRSRSKMSLFSSTKSNIS